MKTNCWLILATMLATTAVAQVNTNKLPEIAPPAATLPATPAPATVAPAPMQTPAPVKKAVTKAKKKIVKKAKPAANLTAKAAEKKAPELPVTLVPGPATVSAEQVNLRGQAGLKGEVVGHVKKGDTVNVLSEITLDKPKAGEPAQWAKIALPSGTKVWVDSHFIDASNNTVSVKKLNLRGGPGENFSVLGVVEKGANITPVSTKGNWTEIETPPSAFAFVAASYLKQEGPGMTPITPTVATTETVAPPPTSVAPPPVVPPTPTTVAEQPTIAPPATTPPPTPESATAPTPAVTPAPTTTPTPTPTIEPTPTLVTPTAESEDTNPPPPRIVTHEGSVRKSVSLVAPTYFELYDPADDKAINYLYSPSTNLNLARYNGLHITVTGEEGLDPRWQDTPVINVQKIYVLSKDVPLKPISSPATDTTKKRRWYKLW